MPAERRIKDAKAKDKSSNGELENPLLLGTAT
jgi:hypothetical protein